MCWAATGFKSGYHGWGYSDRLHKLWHQQRAGSHTKHKGALVRRCSPGKGCKGVDGRNDQDRSSMTLLELTMLHTPWAGAPPLGACEGWFT